MPMKCECHICRNNLPFEIPSELIESLVDGNLVLFAGAGVSTENDSIFKQTFYEDIRDELDLKDEDLPFPKLMSKFCSLKNGRQKLLEKIKSRFDYCLQFQELYYFASAFHREIAPIFMIQDIFTTNWDDYFERECAAIPIVTAKDFAFYNIKQRKVFKLHGSISNYGSIVATDADYKECYKELNTGLIGANLKTLLATKTIVFVGYSFRDYDFLRILNFLKKEMGNLLPHIYVFTLYSDISLRLEKFDVTVINTNGVYFFKNIKEHLVNNKYIIPEKNIEGLYLLNDLIREEHRQLSDYYFDKKRSPSVIYSLFYQDGIQHALDCSLYGIKSGKTYDPGNIISKLRSYSTTIRKACLKAKNYPDLAYVDGYIEGLAVVLDEEEVDDFPFHYVFGIGPISDKEIAYDIFQRDIIEHKTAERLGRKYFKEFLNHDNDVIPDHRPFIGP